MAGLGICRLLSARSAAREVLEDGKVRALPELGEDDTACIADSRSRIGTN